MGHYTLYFAQAYGEGAYGSCDYSEGETTAGVCAGAGTGTGNSSGGGLADTGIAIAGIVTLACLLIFVALIVRVWRRKSALQEAEVASDERPERHRSI